METKTSRCKFIVNVFPRIENGESPYIFNLWGLLIPEFYLPSKGLLKKFYFYVLPFILFPASNVFKTKYINLEYLKVLNLVIWLLFILARILIAFRVNFWIYEKYKKEGADKVFRDDGQGFAFILVFSMISIGMDYLTKYLLHLE